MAEINNFIRTIMQNDLNELLTKAKELLRDETTRISYKK